jgi:GTPase
MIELEEPRERAILVGAPAKALGPAVVEEHLQELAQLADTAGVQVVGSLVQRLESPNPRLFIGEGKAEELQGLIREHQATLVLFDEELSPAQGKNLEDFTGTRSWTGRS